MNKMRKSKRIKWGSLITICCLIGIILVNVNAKSNLPNAKVKKIANTCNIDSQYNPTITISDGQTAKVTAKVKTGEFWIIVSGGIDELDNINYLEATSFTNSFEKSYDFGNAPIYEIYVILVYKGSGPSSSSCKGASLETAKEIAEHYIKNNKLDQDYIDKNVLASKAQHSMVEISDDTILEPELEQNKYYDSICKDFREATDNVKFSDFQGTYNKYKSKYEENNQIGKDIVSYCYQETVESNYTEKQLISLIKNSLKIYFANQISESPNSIDLKVNAIEKNNVNLSDDYLYCSKDQLTQGVEGYYTNVTSYYHTETNTETYKNNTTCKKTCEEKITVKYGPPVASKAGMCFEYKVKVESKVNCKSEFSGTKPTKQKVCKIYPVCNNTSNWYDQAGPDEDFDNCVLDCDNGNYSQSCINKCYKKVYQSINSKKLLYDDNSNNVEFLATDPSYSVKASFCNRSDDPKSNDSNYKTLVNNIRSGEAYENEEGKQNCGYEMKGTNIIWSCAGKYGSTDAKYGYSDWRNLGRYYFLTDFKASQTIRSIAADCNGELRGSKYYKYYIDSQGFKRAWLNSDRSRSCSQSCRWVKNTSDCVLNQQDADQNYAAAYEEYADNLNSCKAEASCNTKTAEFTISIKNPTSKDKNHKITFDKAEIRNTNGAITGADVNSANSIIISSGQCYGKDKSNEYDYMTEWGFPGTWINNKTGEISYVPKTENSAWKEKKDKFCTSLDSIDVNTDWWDWSQTTKKDEPDAKYNGGIDQWNIEAATKNFGHFEWNISLKCFYAIHDNYDCPSGNCNTIKTCEGNDCDSATLSYRIRSIDNNDLFPDEARGKGDDKTIGFNWTVKSNSNVADQNYQIVPVALRKNIENSTTYSSDNLEYEFVLSKSDLNKLKKAKDNYTTFNGTFNNLPLTNIKGEKYNIAFYRSTIIREITESDIRRDINKKCNNWFNSNSNSGCTFLTPDKLLQLGGINE